MLHLIRWHPLIGWEPCFAVALDCGTPGPLYGGQYSVYHHGEDGMVYFVFGRADDINIACVKISFKFVRYSTEEEQREIWTEEQSRTINRKHVKEQDGHLYFVENFGLIFWNHDFAQRVILTAYDKNGQEVTKLDISLQRS